MAMLFKSLALLTILPLADATCQCKKPSDLTTMPMNGTNKYNLVEAGVTYQIADTYGSTCIGTNDGLPDAVVLSYGCTEAELNKTDSWCYNKWCYVDACVCAADYSITETMSFIGTTGLYWTYDICCKTQFTTETQCNTTKGSGECTWKSATLGCRMSASPSAYLQSRCTSKGTDATKCNAFTACKWASGACGVESQAAREAALNCGGTAGGTDVTNTSGATRSASLVAAAATAAWALC